MNLKGILEEMCGHEIDEYTHGNKIDEWLSWYRGDVSDFHTYYQYNGRTAIKRKRYTMNMAKRVCEDWANLLINEKTDITLGEEGATEKLSEFLYKKHFWMKANQAVEKSFALSMGAFVVRVTNLPTNDDGVAVGEGDLNLSFVNATKIFPLQWDEDDNITECAFVSRIRKDRYSLAVHHLDESGNYLIENAEATGNDEKSLTVDASTRYTFDTESGLPWFTIFHPNIANNIDVNSPLWVSIFANSIDRLKACDLIFDSSQNEFLLGKKRVFLDVRDQTIDPNTGDFHPVFDPNDVAIYQLPPSEDGGHNTFADQTQTLRVNEHNMGLQAALDNLSDSVGFGTKHYKFDEGNIATAKQVVSENSDLFRSIKKHETVVEDCLITIVRAILYAGSRFCGLDIAPVDTEISVKFDDSIIVDKDTEKESDRTDVGMGVMSKAEYRAKWYAEDEQTAADKIREIETTALEGMMEQQQMMQSGAEKGEDEA